MVPGKEESVQPCMIWRVLLCELRRLAAADEAGIILGILGCSLPLMGPDKYINFLNLFGLLSHGKRETGNVSPWSRIYFCSNGM